MSVRFYCESCKYEVPLDMESCPNCGKVFYSVLCPRCGREGYPREFKSGCPQCGYMKETLLRSKKQRNIIKKQQRMVPLWMYQIGAILLSLAVIGLLVYIFANNLLPQ